jgi:hypothetical protein
MESVFELKNVWTSIANFILAAWPQIAKQIWRPKIYHKTNLYTTPLVFYCILAIANMLFNLGTIVLKAELDNMWHTENEYAMKRNYGHIWSYQSWHRHSIIIIDGKECVESLSMFHLSFQNKYENSLLITHYSLLITHYSLLGIQTPVTGFTFGV